MSRALWRSPLWLLSLVILGFGCSAEHSDSVVVASIDGRPAYFSDFEAYVRKNVDKDPNELPAEVLAPMFETFIDELCLRQLAIDRGLGPSSAEGPGAAEQLLASLPPAIVSEAEIRRYYETHGEDFLRPERVVLGQILVQNRQVADEVLQAIRAGADFASAGVGRPDVDFSGYQKEVAREDLPPAFAEQIFSLEAGSVSSVVAAEYGFHLFHVVDRLPGEELSLSQATEVIETKLRQRRTSETVRQMVREARIRYNVELFPRNLPFTINLSGEPHALLR